MIDRAAYQEFCTEHQEVPLFMQPWYLDACTDAGRWLPIVAIMDGRVAGIWPVVLKRKWFVHTVTMPPFLRFCGPVLAPWLKTEHSKLEVLRSLYAQTPSVLRFSQDAPYATEHRLLNQLGFRVTERISYVLEDIHRQDEVYFGMKGDYRNNKLPKAEKVYRFTDDIPLEAFLTLHETTYQRQKMRVPASHTYITRLHKALVENKAGVLIGAQNRDTGNLDAIAWLASHGDTSYLLATADVHAERKNAPSIYIQWHAIRYAFDHFGATRFDFLGSMLPNIASVRKQFGAKPVVYHRLERGLLSS